MALQDAQCETQIVVSGGDIWVDPDCVCDQVDTTLGLVSLQRDRPEQMQRVEVARLLPQDFLISSFFCLAETSLVQRH